MEKIGLQKSGQTTVEYILLLGIIVGIFMGFRVALFKFKLDEVFLNTMKKHFARTYRYGSPKVLGENEGGPKYHPRVEEGKNFRIFINPKTEPP